MKRERLEHRWRKATYLAAQVHQHAVGGEVLHRHDVSFGAGLARSTQLRSAGSCSPSLVEELTELLATQPGQLVLLQSRESVFDVIVDVGLAHPPGHRLDRYIEIVGDVSEGQTTAIGDVKRSGLKRSSSLLSRPV